MSALGMRTFSGITVGLAGSLIGIHLSLFTSAIALLLVTAGLLLRFRVRPSAQGA